jgi:trk system potassium uptake protein TrkA
MKFCVIGLGRFGYQVATTLAENGMEVLGVDSSETIIASIRDVITQAVCLQIIDETSLRSIGVEEMDTVIVAVGENFAESILITALLKKRLNIPRVITRAVSSIHREILLLVGADRVVLPEQEIGKKLANNLSSPLLDTLKLSEHFFISYVTAPERFIGKKIEEINFYKNYKVRCVGIKKDEEMYLADPQYIVKKDDKFMLAGDKDDINRIARL